MHIADLHCDTISRIYQKKQLGESADLRSNPFHVDLEKMKRSGYLLQNFAVFVDVQKTESPFADCQGQIALFQEEMAKNKDAISPAASYMEILENQREGKMSALLSLEEGELCQGSLKQLEKFYSLGVRMMTFTWNYPNSLGNPTYPNTDEEQGKHHISPAYPNTGSGGLTPLGIEFLGEMERLGLIPDVSHLSDAGIEDVCRLAKKPFCASHSNARSLCAHPRNLPDRLIRSIGAHGGMIGANYYGEFLSPQPDSLGRYGSHASQIASHIRHISNVGGISCIGLGSDFDGFEGASEIEDCSRLSLLAQALHKIGFHESEIERIFYKNVLEFYRELL